MDFILCGGVYAGDCALCMGEHHPPEKTPPAAWTFSPQNNEELLISLPSLYDVVEMATVDWDSGEGGRLWMYVKIHNFMC